MPKPNPRSVVLGHPEPEDTLTDLGELIEDRIQEILDHPARAEIICVLRLMHMIELDITDPALYEHAVTVGIRRTAATYGRPVERHKHHHDPVIYYFQIGEVVKIGITQNVVNRWAAFSPERVLAIEPGSYSLEGARHRQFAELHIHGEWFRLGASLEKHTTSLYAAAERALGAPLPAWLRDQGLPI